MSLPIRIIPATEAPTLALLFAERVRRTPDACAYRRFDHRGHCCDNISWRQTAHLAARWQAALDGESLAPGDRVGVMLRNSLEWVLFDLAALGMGLITVPLYHYDRTDNIAYILEQTGAKLLVCEGESQHAELLGIQRRLLKLRRIVARTLPAQVGDDPRWTALEDWLPQTTDAYRTGDADPGIATIVYTSGTTGRPKGVMLTHANILSNVYACLERIPVRADARFLSFLPLSHMLERTVGYYLPMAAGASVTHVRSLENLREDFQAAKPTNITCVPRTFERIHKHVQARLHAASPLRRRVFALALAVGRCRFLHAQGRAPWSWSFMLWPLLRRVVAAPVLAILGGKVELAVSGGAPLDPELSLLFNALGLTLVQGYGLTETSPVVSTNTPEDNHPDTVGRPLPGVEVRLGGNGELLVRGPCVMLGYWRDSAATRAAIDSEGWLHTGDLAVIDAEGHITLSGRLKDIIVLANGEKVSPADLESAIARDPLFEQVMVVGDRRPYLTALVVLNAAEWNRLAPGLGLNPEDRGTAAEKTEQALLQRISARLAGFPGFARIRRVLPTPGPWEVKTGALTATMKLRRATLVLRFAAEIDRLYAGH